MHIFNVYVRLKCRSTDQKLDLSDSAAAMSNEVERQHFARRKQKDYTGLEDVLPVSVWENMCRARALKGRIDALCSFLHISACAVPLNGHWRT